MKRKCLSIFCQSRLLIGFTKRRKKRVKAMAKIIKIIGHKKTLSQLCKLKLQGLKIKKKKKQVK